MDKILTKEEMLMQIENIILALNDRPTYNGRAKAEKIYSLFASQLNPVSDARWVKASERLPETSRNYHVKVQQFDGRGIYNDACVYKANEGKFFDNYKTNNGRAVEVNVIEWLDETPSSVPQKGVVNEVRIKIDYPEHGKVKLTNERGDTYTSYSEELGDFFHSIKQSPPTENDAERK